MFAAASNEDECPKILSAEVSDSEDVPSTDQDFQNNFKTKPAHPDSVGEQYEFADVKIDAIEQDPASNQWVQEVLDDNAIGRADRWL